MHHQWKIRRHLVEAPDALQRWDRAYQSLLCWSANHAAHFGEESQHQEDQDESCTVCAGIDAASSTDADD